jgi:ribosomal protein S18 acetylase RimI-like enzyme
VRIWVAGSGDAAEVTRLMVAFRDWNGRDWPDADAFGRGVERLLADEDTEFLLAAVDHAAPAVGVCQLRFRYGLWWDAPDCLLEDLFVEEEARGKGLGEALVNAAIERARERGCRRIELDANEGNTPAIKLYERLGFNSYSERLGGHDRFMRLRL